jgi:dTDP-4-dehydrorhamnose reductase
MSTIVIGKNSFLASHLEGLSSAAGWEFLTHEEALARPNALKSARVIVNCAFHPDLADQEYDADKDIDFAIASLIQNSDAHYIMMSSRMVYGNAPDDLMLSEDAEPKPVTIYGRNKLTIEQALQDVLPAKHLTILRMANIFGYEPERSSFFGTMITSLQESGVINFDIAPDSQRDFLSVWGWADYMEQVIPKPIGGIFNVGSGFGTTPQELAEVLINEANKGKAAFNGNSYDGQFILDVRKLLKSYNLVSYTKLDLLSDVEEVARLSVQ